MNFQNINKIFTFFLAALFFVFSSLEVKALPSEIVPSTLSKWYSTTTDNNAGDIGRIQVGDFDCDGISDVIFGAEEFAGGFGVIYVDLGIDGFTSDKEISPSSGDMDITIYADTLGEGLGFSVVVGDVDGDGCDDIISLKQETVTENDQTILIPGGTAWSVGYNGFLSGVASYHLLTHTSSDNFERIANIGPIDGDYNSDGTVNFQDSFVSVCSVSNTTCYLIPVENLDDGTDFATAAVYRVIGDRIYNSVRSADINADGQLDLIVGNDEDVSTGDNVSIFFGPLNTSLSMLSDAQSPPNYFESGIVSGKDIVIWDVVPSFGGYGTFVGKTKVFASAGDDLLISGHLDDCGAATQAGRYHVIKGSSLSALRDSIVTSAGIEIYNDDITGTYNYSDLEVVLLGGDEDYARLGSYYGASGEGDFNGDGIDDLVLGGDSYYAAIGANFGVVHITYGGAINSLIGSEVHLGALYDDSDVYLMGGVEEHLSTNVLAADLNNDGLDDLIITAPEADSGNGEIYLLEGTITDLDADGFDSAVDFDGDGVFEPFDCNDKDATVTPNTWYLDSDSDGYGDASTSVQLCLQPVGYVSNPDDCDDSNPDIHPGASEVCDGVDNNCAGGVDEGVLNTYYQDSDGDLFGNPAVTDEACAAPVGYVEDNTDCDDTSDAVHPGASEICDGLDNNCAGGTDEGVLNTYYQDSDEDLFGNPAVTLEACSPPVGYVSDNTDCNDSSGAAYPGASEVCDGLDNDCNGATDEVGSTPFYQDSDGDLHGNPSVSVLACSAPVGYVANSDDCDDTLSHVYDGAAELCDGIDNDCDGAIDEEGMTTYYLDGDSDGYGDASSPLDSCGGAPVGYVSDNTDCDDSLASVHPTAPEACDGLDNDCDGATDEEGLSFYYEDGDSDGFGNAAVSVEECAPPVGFVSNNTDCDDTNGDIHPTALETCDGVDNNCDGGVDEGVLNDYYQDSDGDGHGNAAVSLQACVVPLGYVVNDIDCDDTNDAIYPGADEICDGIDNNCDGESDDGVGITYYPDSDGDGYGVPGVTIEACEPPLGYAATDTDCDDANAAVFPGNTEVCDGFDNDCSGVVDEGVLTTYYQDADGDGFGNAASSVEECAAPLGYVIDDTDCNDADGSTYVGAPELCDGVDNDCNGLDDDGVAFITYYADSDGDGYGDAASFTQTCSGAPVGYVDNLDDCNDADAATHPEALEIADQLDNNCNTHLDDGLLDVHFTNVPDTAHLGDVVTLDYELTNNTGFSHLDVEVLLQSQPRVVEHGRRDIGGGIIERTIRLKASVGASCKLIDNCDQVGSGSGVDLNVSSHSIDATIPVDGRTLDRQYYIELRFYDPTTGTYVGKSKTWRWARHRLVMDVLNHMSSNGIDKPFIKIQ